MNFKVITIGLILSFINSLNAVKVEVTNDGPGVLDIPITFRAQLIGEVSVDNVYYVFEDNLNPRHRFEIISNRTANITITYSDVSIGSYLMNVQVFAIVWGFKGWLIAEEVNKFVLQNSLSGIVNISQVGISDKALSDSIVMTNRTVTAMAVINDGTHFLKNASISYWWVIEEKTFGPNSSPVFTYNFTQNMTYMISVMVLVNITQPNLNITKLGRFTKQIKAKNAIKDLNVNGNTWLLNGVILQLDVNCTGGSPTFWYCWEIFSEKKVNYSCSEDFIYINKCSFPIIHYFPKNGTYFVEIGLYNDVDYIHKTIQVNVYEIVRQTQLSFVIIPIVSSILAIIIVVVGVAYHLQQRQRYNITLEIADFDFQCNEDLNEKTFFERLRESFGSSLRGTLHPCTRGEDCDDLIEEDLVSNQRINNVSVNPNNTNNKDYEAIK